jgi:hypothetical protein
MKGGGIHWFSFLIELGRAAEGANGTWSLTFPITMIALHGRSPLLGSYKVILPHDLEDHQKSYNNIKIESVNDKRKIPIGE